MLVIYISAIFCNSCAAVQEKISMPMTPETRLFQSAEENYRNRQFKEAFSQYQEYLLQFSNSDLAPKVLVRMGQSQTELGNYSRAETFFQRVIKEYPNTPYVTDAGIERLRTYYFEGEYQKVVQESEKNFTGDLTQDQSLSFYLLVGDSHLAMKSPLKAYHEFIKAYQAADPKDLDQVISRLKTTIALLPDPDIRYELKQLDDRPPAGYLMYQLGKNYSSEGKTDEALSVFQSFVQKFSDHEYTGQVSQMIADIKSPAPKEVKTIGCLLPLSGKYEAFGQRSLKGVELALEIFARDRGIESLKIQIKDTASEAAMAEQSIQELVDGQAIAVIGPVAASEEAAAKAQELKIPIITLTQKSNITDVGDYVFRNFLTPEMQVKTLVSYAMGTLNVKRFAILYPDEGYGTTFMKLFTDDVNKSGGVIADTVGYNPTLTEFTDTVKKLIKSNYATTPIASAQKSDNIRANASSKESEMDHEINTDQESGGPKPVVNFDAVFIPDSPDKAGLMIPLFPYYGVRDIYLLGTNLWHSEKMIQMISSQIQGAVIPDGFFEKSDSEKVVRFVGEFEKMYGYTPGFIEAVSYDTAMMLFNLANEPDVRSAKDMKEKLLAMPPYPGVTGTTSFDAKGEAVKDIYLLKVIGGKFKEIYYK